MLYFFALVVTKAPGEGEEEIGEEEEDEKDSDGNQGMDM